MHENGSRASSQNGITLVELMITLAVLAVVITLAVPSFNALIRNNRIYTQINDLHLSLMRARAEAMSQVKRITVCTSSDAATCNATGKWEDGWIVFVEHNATQNAAVDSGEEILQVQQKLSGGNTLRGDTNVTNYISYVGTGFSTQISGGVQTGKLALCDIRGLGSGRVILINAAGRPRVVDALGNATTCTSP